jgi:uncharacterized protein (TIGR03382 family)
VPANLPGIYWRPLQSNVESSPPDPSMVVLATTADPQTALPFTATQLSNGDYLLVPDAPLVEGTDYTIVEHKPCGTTPDAGPHVTFHVVAAAPLPTSLGTLAVVEHQEDTFSVGTAIGSCSSEVLADEAQVALTPSDDALPWKAALHYQTLVDGEVWGAWDNLNSSYAPGSSWAGLAVDRVYHVCSTDDDSIGRGIATGTHQVSMTATLPGSTVAIDAPAVPVDFECSGSDSGSGSGSDGPLGGDQVEDGCNAGGGSTALPLALLALLAIRSRRRD